MTLTFIFGLPTGLLFFELGSGWANLPHLIDVDDQTLLIKLTTSKENEIYTFEQASKEVEMILNQLLECPLLEQEIVVIKAAINRAKELKFI